MGMCLDHLYKQSLSDTREETLLSNHAFPNCLLYSTCRSFFHHGLQFLIVDLTVKISQTEFRKPSKTVPSAIPQLPCIRSIWSWVYWFLYFHISDLMHFLFIFEDEVHFMDDFPMLDHLQRLTVQGESTVSVRRWTLSTLDSIAAAGKHGYTGLKTKKKEPWSPSLLETGVLTALRLTVSAVNEDHTAWTVDQVEHAKAVSVK